MLWEIDIYPKKSEKDNLAEEVMAEIFALGLVPETERQNIGVRTGRGYLLQGDLNREEVEKIAKNLLADMVVEETVVFPLSELAQQVENDSAVIVHVLPKPGVMDPVAMSAKTAISDFGVTAEEVRTFRKYHLTGLDEARIEKLCWKVLANDAIEQVVRGPFTFTHLEVGTPYEFQLVTVPIREMDEEALKTLSLKGQLYLSLVEMQTIQKYFQDLKRDPTDVELETVAQTWSEHCSHKTLAGRIAYKDDEREITFQNMLKETIFAATEEIRKNLGENDWCVSVFKDNAGVVTFDTDYNLAFKVETHNHPSALEPYGGANTGIGGVIRDPMGTGMGAKPICNTDVFCFAPPEMSLEDIPAGVLHPKRVMRGVVSGVRDYGNRMGIPTINGAVYFDERYLGNPLVYCGNLGIIPVDKSFKKTYPGDLIVAVGGRTGRDGIHGATFSSAELTHESESLSGGAVQIGNAITEKMTLDILLEARDRGLYTAVTDCGAGGFSSAVGEMGEEIGAEVWLEKIPLKYEGISYSEMWISEAQERMVFSVPEEKWPELEALCKSEDVEATVIGRFVPTGRLMLKYGEHVVADLEMDFMHHGRPPVVREATYAPPAVTPMDIPIREDYTETLTGILGSYNVSSKHWVVRQYDHEVQGGSVIKPLVGVQNDGPGDASVIRPRFESYQGVVVSCGMNPRFGDYDTYWMAASAIDEALRNAVAVGADPAKIAILDNFCWGTTDRPETLGSLVRSAIACHDMSLALGTPFISGKDSLNNEFRPEGKDPISIPPSLLISALGQVRDVHQCVTMDLKGEGNYLFQVGMTRNEMGGSHFGLVENCSGGEVPKVDFIVAKKTFAAMHAAISAGTVRACHDLSEGGLAVAAAEMGFAGEIGVNLELACVPYDGDRTCPECNAILLFSESNTRFLCEVTPENAEAFTAFFTQAGIPVARVGMTEKSHAMRVLDVNDEKMVIAADLKALKKAWQAPLNW
ncbi:MAG: phosphoribosylformylglycinamidine synthase subunit PurL [Planctomycetia bacterium]|nr:phosphoribosylformylglycinamidine synthase subunit PurL [Planctomycetia bacterium]